MSPIRLYHYAVFLKTTRGTVRKNIAVPRRDIKAAGRRAQDAVARHLRNGARPQIADVVPLREKASKAAPRIIKPRSRRPTTVRKVKFVLARRPRARVSAILTKKGVRAYTPRDRDEDWAPTKDHQPVTERTPETGKRTSPQWCEEKVCLKAGFCKHARLGDSLDLVCYEAIIKVGTGEAVLRCFVQDGDVRRARKLMRGQLADMGLAHKRITRLGKTYAPDPLRASDGRLIRR